MQTLKGYFDLLNSAKTTLFTIGVIIVAALNLWLGTKLSPIASELQTNTGDIKVVKADVELIRQECLAMSKQTEAKIDEGFNKIEKRIEILDDRNLEIYKILINK
jgi:hypothetical protein